MTIEHIALWTEDLERSKKFYCTYFGGTSNTKYFNPIRQFESYFISFENGTRLEIMKLPNLIHQEQRQNLVGLTHIAFKVHKKEEVDRLTNVFREQGITIFSEPRMTGDGYYESVVLDPDGNMIELVF